MGTIQVLSGDLGVAGDEHIQTIQLALANRDNQILGHPITLQNEDDQCSPEGGANSALKIVADPQIIGIVGTLCTTAALEASGIMSKAGLVMISGTNNAASLTSVADAAGSNWHPGYFRTSENDAQRLEAMVAFLTQKLGVSKGAIVHISNQKEFVEQFEQTLTQFGGELVFDGSIDKEQTDIQPLLNTLINSKVEFILLSSAQVDSASVVKRIAETPELEGVFMLAAGPILTPEFLTNTGEAAEGIYFVETIFSEGDTVKALKAKYEIEYGELLFEFYDTAYDASNILFTAIETAAIQETDGTLHIGRQALREAMYNTTDLVGVTGNLNCDKFGDCGVAPTFDFYQVGASEMDVDTVKANVIYSYTLQE